MNSPGPGLGACGTVAEPFALGVSAGEVLLGPVSRRTEGDPARSTEGAEVGGSDR